MAWRWMVYDIDSADAYHRAEDRGCPPPTFIALNRENGHAHIAYLLESPVTVYDASSRKAMRFYEDVERGFTNKLGADRCYSGFLSKNPLSDAWLVDWQAKTPYQLATLNDCLESSDKRKLPKGELSTVGRNTALFDGLREVGYKQWYSYRKAGKSFDDFAAMILVAGEGVNNTFSRPMTHAEVKGIARSVARWIWKSFSLEKFSVIQSARGKKAWSKTATLTAAKPWEAEGISRRTWYSRNCTKTISG